MTVAIDLNESVIHEEHDVVVTSNEEGDEITIWELTDTLLIKFNTEEELAEALKGEIRFDERTGVVMDVDTGYTKIYRPHMSVHVYRNVEDTIERILKEMYST